MVEGSGDGTQSRQEARLGLQPLTDYAGTSFTIGRPSLRKDVIDDVIQFDAERVLNDLGGLFAVVTVDGSFQQVTHVPTSRTSARQDSHKLDHHPSAAFRFARRHRDLADRSGRLRQLRQQRLQQQNSDRNGSRQDDQSGPHFRNARDVEWSRVRKPHSPISAPRVAQKIKRQHHRIDERLQGLGCAVVVVRSLCHDDSLLRRLRSLHLQGLIFALKVVRPHRNISK